MKKEVKIGECGYTYIQNNNTHTLLYSDKDKGWMPHILGQIAFQLIDTGNGIQFTQTKKRNLDYSEMELLMYILNEKSKRNNG